VFDVAEDPGEGLVEVIAVAVGLVADVGEEVCGIDEEPLLLDDVVLDALSVSAGEATVVEVGVAGVVFALVDEGGDVFGDEAVEQHAEDVGLEVPPVDAASQVVSHAPDGLVQFCTFSHSAVFAHLLILACGTDSLVDLALPAPARRQDAS
jgi:hypothetical protein